MSREVPQYIPYPRALALLKDRLGASPAEVAAWVWFGPETGGLCAYRNANELTEPPRFFFSESAWVETPDYLAELASAWFCLAEISKFEPADRYITGSELCDRWSVPVARLGIGLDAYVRAKIEESRLMDFHPNNGESQWSEDGAGLAPRESALFELARVLAIEDEDGIEPCARDLGACERSTELVPGTADPEMGTPKPAGRQSKHLANSEGRDPRTLEVIVDCRDERVTVIDKEGASRTYSRKQVTGKGTRTWLLLVLFAHRFGSVEGGTPEIIRLNYAKNRENLGKALEKALELQESPFIKGNANSIKFRSIRAENEGIDAMDRQSKSWDDVATHWLAERGEDLPVIE